MFCNFHRFNQLTGHLNPQHPSIKSFISTGACKVIKCFLSNPNDVTVNEWCSLCRTLLWMLDGAFPLQYSPSAVIVLRKFAKYSCKINLPVSQRSESACSLDPTLVSAIHALLACWVKFSILHMEHLDSLMVEINELEVIQALKHKVAWIIQDVCP